MAAAARRRSGRGRRAGGGGRARRRRAGRAWVDQLVGGARGEELGGADAEIEVRALQAEAV